MTDMTRRRLLALGGGIAAIAAAGALRPPPARAGAPRWPRPPRKGTYTLAYSNTY